MSLNNQGRVLEQLGRRGSLFTSLLTPARRSHRLVGQIESLSNFHSQDNIIDDELRARTREGIQQRHVNSRRRRVR